MKNYSVVVKALKTVEVDVVIDVAAENEIEAEVLALEVAEAMLPSQWFESPHGAELDETSIEIAHVEESFDDEIDWSDDWMEGPIDDLNDSFMVTDEDDA